MRYAYLTEVGVSYQSEENKASFARAEPKCWEHIEIRLKKAIVDLRNAEGSRAAPTGSSVKDLINFHKAEQNRVSPQNVAASLAAAAEARKAVARQRRWLAAEGATADEDGNIDWSKMMDYVVVYDKSLQEQGLTRVWSAGGRLYTDALCRSPLDTKNMVTHISGPGKAIFVMSQTGNLHVSSHVIGHRHHSSLLGGRKVACAGELEVDRGLLVWLSNKSGHYAPSVAHLLQTLHQLQKNMVPMTFRLMVWYPPRLHPPKFRNFSTVGEFLKDLEMAGKPDYELGKLMAYTQHLTPAVLGPKGWEWRHMSGVYVSATGLAVPHKEVRRWLKSTGRMPTIRIQGGHKRW